MNKVDLYKDDVRQKWRCHRLTNVHVCVRACVRACVRVYGVDGNVI